MIKKVVATLALLGVSVLAVWSVSDSYSQTPTPKKLHSHIDHKPQQKMHSNLQIKIERIQSKFGDDLLRGVIQSRRPVSEVVYYQWILPRGLNPAGLALEGQISGLNNEGEIIDLNLGRQQLPEGQSVILTAHFYRDQKKLGNSASHKLTPPSLLPQNLKKSSSTKPPPRPKIIY